MATYCTLGDITPHLGGRALNTAESPTQTEVTEWMDDAEAELLATLEAMAIGTVHAVDSRPYRTLRRWISEYVSGLVRASFAGAGGDGSNADGKVLRDAWKELLGDIRKDPSFYGGLLTTSGGSPAATILSGSHVTDGVVTSDYGPVYKRTHYTDGF